jgi:hypothetical protein
MQSKSLILWSCGLLMAAGCGPASELEGTASAAATSPRHPEGFARQLVGSFAARDKDAFMALVISEAAMTEIVEATSVDDDAKAKMIAEIPTRVGPRRAAHAEAFEARLEAGHLEGVRWEETAFVGVEVLWEHADSGTVTRELRISLDISGVAYTMGAKQCISQAEGPIFLLSELQGPISETAARVEGMQGVVQVVHAAATAYFAEKGEYPMDVPALAKEGGGDIAVDDAWGTELSMWARGAEVQICSAGPDTTHGTYDDICWPK